MTVLPDDVLEALRGALARQPDVSRALLLTGGDKPALVFEYDERPPSVSAAQARLQKLLAAVAPVLGDAAYGLGFSAGGPEEVARLAAGAEVVYERGRAA